MKPGPVLPENRVNRVSSETFPLELGYLPERFIRKAEDELKETPETRETSLKQMRELIENDKHLFYVPMNDDYLLQFLRSRKMNVQKAFTALKKFNNFVRKHKSYFAKVTPESMAKNIQEKIFTFLPLRDKDGCTILLIKLAKWNPSEVPVEDVIRMVVLYLKYSLTDPMTQVNGYKILFDFKCNPLRYIRFCTPYYAYLIYHGTQECIPARFKAIHILNPSIIFKTFFPIIAPFMPEKLKKRFIIHDNSPKLQNYLPDCLIPLEYGGELKDYDFGPFSRKCKLPDCVKFMLGEAPEADDRR